jgi:hypothetical protein
VPESALKGHPLPEPDRVAKTITGGTYAQVEKSLDAGTGAGWAAVSGSGTSAPD